MRIVLDVSLLSHRRSGIGNYVRGMIAGLAQTAGDRHELVGIAPSSLPGLRRIREALAGLPIELRLAFLPFAHAWRQAWSQAGWPPVERFTGRLDVFHFSDWMYPAQRGGLRVTTVHDLVPLRFPQWVASRTRRMHGAKLANAARSCGLVVVNSRFTGRDLQERLGISAERIAVAYPGIDPLFLDGATQRPQSGRPFILTVSTLEPRKNLGTLIAAFRLLRERRPELELVVAGGAGWGERHELAVPGVRWLGYVPDVELAGLYRGAAAFAYPSLFEGFGMPAVEAMACGAPAVVSAHPSLDEAAGGLALRADPESCEQWAEMLERALELPQELRAQGVAHARSFSFEACGQAVLSAYQERL